MVSGEKMLLFPTAGGLGAVWGGLVIGGIVRRGVAGRDLGRPHRACSRLGVIGQARRVWEHAGSLQGQKRGKKALQSD